MIFNHKHSISWMPISAPKLEEIESDLVLIQDQDYNPEGLHETYIYFDVREKNVIKREDVFDRLGVYYYAWYVAVNGIVLIPEVEL